ncbi:unnamed protein product [Brachionus calyciflorus]|uniref:Reverse transcriptase domain-containing protein n=1 Tax=Brachionus calyciflorus TaxID=104777 RepID=A0A813Y784_9BILA|nr:unnamed protein product [Brachionus calyciflorus]
MESFIKDEILKHLIKNKLITKSQHVSVPNKSCLNNPLETMSVLGESEHSKNAVDIFYLDFLDRIFFKNRKQIVVLRKASSTWKDVISGVPQGSVLGPLLFVIYIIDLPDGILNMCKLFADDTKVIGQIVDIAKSSALQKDQDYLNEWSKN